MKKLLYFLVSMLSLAIIFAAGWASAASSSSEQLPVNVREATEENGDITSDEKESPERHEKRTGHRHGFRVKMPQPRFDDDVILIPKMPL